MNKAQRFQQSLSRIDINKRVAHDDRTEQALLIAYKNGDEDAGWELFTSYSEVIATIYKHPTRAPRNTPDQKKLEYDTLTAYEKEDLFQEIAYQFFKLAIEYEPDKPFEHAVRAILHQRVFNQFFAKELDIRFNEAEFEEGEEFEQKLSDILESAEVTDTPDKHLDLYQALNQLGARQREVVTFSVVKGWNSSEIAKELGISAGAVRFALKAGLDKLKAIMNPEEEKQDEEL